MAKLTSDQIYGMGVKWVGKGTYTYKGKTYNSYNDMYKVVEADYNAKNNSSSNKSSTNNTTSKDAFTTYKKAAMPNLTNSPFTEKASSKSDPVAVKMLNDRAREDMRSRVSAPASPFASKLAAESVNPANYFPLVTPKKAIQEVEEQGGEEQPQTRAPFYKAPTSSSLGRTVERLENEIIQIDKELRQLRGGGVAPEQSNLDKYNEKLNELYAKRKELNSAKANLGVTKYREAGVALSDEIRKDDKYKEYVAKGEALGNEKADGWLVPDTQRKNVVAYLRNNPEALKMYENALKGTNGTVKRTMLEGNAEYKLAKYGTQEQVETYYAYLGKGDTENAENYLKYIEESLNARMSTGIAMDQNNLWKKLTFGVTAGTDQFQQGMANIAKGVRGDDYIPASPTQMASSKVRESLKYTGPEFLGASVGQGAYDFITTTSNMAPSIGASFLANAIVPGSGAVVGTSLMGGSAAGNSYQEKLNAGWTKDQAATYATIVGVSEACLQYAMGGVGALGGKLTGTSAQAIARGIDNAVLRFVTTYGMKMTSEGLEEALQEVLNPFFENIALGYKKNKWSDIEWEQVAYSGMLGALSAGLLEGGSTAVEVFGENKSANKYGKSLKDGGYAARILEIAATSEEGSETKGLYKTYTKKGVNADNITDLQLGRLFVNAEADARSALSNVKNKPAQLGLVLSTVLELDAMKNAPTVETDVSKPSEVTDTPEILEQAAREVVEQGESEVVENNVATTPETTPDTPVTSKPAEATSVPETLESAARETVESRKKNSGKTTAKKLDALTRDNQPIYVEEVKAVTKYGDKGSELVTKLANQNGTTFTQAKNAVQTAYELGLTGVDKTKVNLTTPTQNAAFEAGRIDRAMDDSVKIAESKNATIYDGAFTENEYTKNFTKAEKKMIATVAKLLRMDVSAVDKIIASETYDNFGNKIEHEANASHNDGKMVISNNRSASALVYKMVLHEGGHRMSQFATKEWGVLMNALYQRAQQRNLSRTSQFESVKAEHDNAGIDDMNTIDYIEEVAVRELETIFSSAEEFNKWYAEINSNPELKSNWQKICDFISEIIEEIKRAWSQRNMTAEEKAVAREQIAELERIRGLLAETLQASEKAATELAKSKSENNLDNKADADGKANFSLKEFEGKNVVWIEESGLTKKQLNNHQAVAEYIAQHIGEVYTIIESGQKVYIGEDLPQEYTQSKYTTFLRGVNQTAARGKNKAVDGFGELIETATNRRWEKTRHTQNKDAKYGMYRYDNSFAFPIKDNKGNVVNVRAFDVELLIRNASDGNKYLYDIVGIEENTTTEIGLLERMTRLPNESQATRDSASKERIPQNPKSVKGSFSLKDSKGNTLTEAQHEYFKDSKVRDDKGRLIPVYHGTRKADFTVFKRNVNFFTDSKEMADSYSPNGEMFEGYLNITKPYEIDAAGEKWSKIPVDEATKQFLQEYGASVFKESGKWRTTPADIAAAIEEAVDNGEMDYDGIIIKNIDDTGSYYKGNEKHIATDYISFNSNQFKNSDNTKPTSNPDVRFSLKDSDYLNAVESGDTETASKMVEEAAKTAGYDIKAYHGTPNKDFTVFDKNRVGKGTDQYGAGFYFASNEDAARSYGARVIDSFVSLKKPIKINGSSEEGANLIDGGYNYLLTEKQAYEVIKRLPNIYDPEESPLGDYYDSYWENGAEDWMIEDLAANEFNRNIGYLDSDLFRYYPNELHEALRDVVGYDGVEVNFANGDKFYVAWFDNQMKSAEPATYDNDGNVIPLSERFNTSNNDIRYSLKKTSDLSNKDTKELLDIIEHLKNEFEVTKFAKADLKKLEKMAKGLLKDYDSKADIEKTVKALDELYQYMANGEDGHPAAWNEVYGKAYEIAENIINNALVVDDELYTTYKGLREYLRKTPIRFDSRYDSVPSGYDNYQDFRRRNWGRFNFTKNGTSIDKVYQELSELYPEFFNADEQINPQDQFERIVEVLDEIQPSEVNPYSSDMQQMASFLANDIIDRFFDVPQAKPTFADKAERRVTEARIAGGKKVEAVRQQKDEKIQKLLDKQRAKTKKLIENAKTKKAEAVNKEKAKREKAISNMKESQKAKVLRAQIMRHANDLSQKLVRPSDNKHIPEDLKGVVAKVLESINLESNYTYDPVTKTYKKSDDGLPTRRTKAFEELRKLYSEIASSVVVDPDLLGEGGLLSDVILLADKRVVDMNSTELQTVWKTICAVEASISTANKMFSKGKYETIFDVAEKLWNDNNGKKGKYYGPIRKGLNVDMLTPETFLHYLGDAGDSMFRMMRDAQDKHISIMKEVADFTHKTLKDVNVNSLEKTIHTVTLGGEEVQLSTAQLMELYVLVKREQAIDHIFKGGILPDVIAKKKKLTRAEPIRNISMAEISGALANLTDDQKKIADKLQRYVSTVLSEYGNEASMQVYNYRKFNEQNYWAIRTNKQEIQSEIGKDTAVTSVANKGMTKATKPHANTSVRIGSIFDTFSSHSSDMATYAAWLGTSEDINRIRNFVFWNDNARVGTVKGILDTVHGTKGSAYLEKLLTDIAIGVQGVDSMNPFDKLAGTYKAASVGANVRVIIQQPTAILRAMDMIGAQHLTAGAYRPLKGWEKAKKYAPIAQWKDWGYFDINTGRQMKDILFDNASVLEKTKQVGMMGASMADSLAWGQLWNAVESETKAKHKGLEVGSEEFYEAVAKRFTEIVDHTQVVDGIMQRSQFMRSADGVAKMATSFMGEPTKQYNMAISAAHDAKNSKGEARKKAYGRLGRTAMSLAVAGIVNACAQSIIDAMRDDDKEEKYWEKWLAAFVGNEDDKWFQKFGNLGDTFNPLTYVPYAKDILSVVQGYDVKRMDMESISKMWSATENLYKAITKTGKYTLAEASASFFAELGRLYGVPVANVKRDIKSAVMTFAIETDNYLMQYRMEKAMLDINYSYNNKNFVDILFNAYNNDSEAYEIIYKDMLKSGYDADKIKSGMETRMKKAEGVKEASELKKRYMTPDTEKKYDSSLKRMQTSQTWKSASSTQRKDAEANLYSFLTSDSEDMEATRAEARALGVDETEYTLWQLAMGMANTDGKDGLSAKEKATALQHLDLDSDTEWDLYLFKVGEDKAKGARYAREQGVSADTYADFIEALYKVDKPTKSGTLGTFTQGETAEAVRSLDGLTQKEKRALYQSVNTTWKKNPF